MPRCPRCGKCLSTRQALEYHLVKKFRCKDNVCYVCNAQFENRNSRDNHLLFCKAKKLYETVKSDECNTTILDRLVHNMRVRDIAVHFHETCCAGVH